MTRDDRENCVHGTEAPPSPALNTAAIRALNDQLRADFVSGIVVLTHGIRQLESATFAAVLIAVRDFDNFSPANDPHGEHDFGAVEIHGQSVFWKIDYYDHRLEAGSTDPSSSDVTTRVLTIMLAAEY